MRARQVRPTARGAKRPMTATMAATTMAGRTMVKTMRNAQEEALRQQAQALDEGDREIGHARRCLVRLRPSKICREAEAFELLREFVIVSRNAVVSVRRCQCDDGGVGKSSGGP